MRDLVDLIHEHLRSPRTYAFVCQFGRAGA
jgi:hypothetical protein